MSNTLFVALPDVARDDVVLEILRSEFSDIRYASSREHALEEAFADGSAITALIIGVKERITRAELVLLSSLRTIATLSVGVDHLDLGAISERSVALVTAKSTNAQAVAEHTLMMMLVQLKNLINARNSVCDGADRAGLDRWPRELANKNVGIVGAGATARRVVKLLGPFGCNIMMWTRSPDRHDDLKESGIQFSDLEHIFRTCEIVSLHIPFTDGTSRLISGDLLLHMPKNAILVNVSRKALLAHADLRQVMSTREDLLLAIDDFGLANEDYAGVALHRSLFTPHIAGTTEESIRAMEISVAHELVRSVRR